MTVIGYVLKSPPLPSPVTVVLYEYSYFIILFYFLAGMEGKATVAILVVIFVFLILWIPFLITRGLMAFNDMHLPPVVNTSVVWILHLNSVVNVIIYTLRRSDYRRAFVAVLRCTSLSRARDLDGTMTIRTDNHDLTVRKTVDVDDKSENTMDNKNSTSTTPVNVN